MLATLLLLLQASAGPTPPRQGPPSPPGQTPPPGQSPPPSQSPPRHDPLPANLATLTAACPAAPTGEIIVGGARQTDRYRLPPMRPPTRRASAPPSSASPAPASGSRPSRAASAAFPPTASWPAFGFASEGGGVFVCSPVAAARSQAARSFR